MKIFKAKFTDSGDIADQFKCAVYIHVSVVDSSIESVTEEINSEMNMEPITFKTPALPAVLTWFDDYTGFTAISTSIHALMDFVESQTDAYME